MCLVRFYIAVVLLTCLNCCQKSISFRTLATCPYPRYGCKRNCWLTTRRHHPCTRGLTSPCHGAYMQHLALEFIEYSGGTLSYTCTQNMHTHTHTLSSPWPQRKLFRPVPERPGPARGGAEGVAQTRALPENLAPILHEVAQAGGCTAPTPGDRRGQPLFTIPNPQRNHDTHS